MRNKEDRSRHRQITVRLNFGSFISCCNMQHPEKTLQPRCSTRFASFQAPQSRRSRPRRLRCCSTAQERGVELVQFQDGSPFSPIINVRYSSSTHCHSRAVRMHYGQHNLEYRTPYMRLALVWEENNTDDGVLCRQINKTKLVLAQPRGECRFGNREISF